MDPFRNRKIIIQLIFITIFLIYISKLLYLQVFDNTYAELANQNVVRKVTQYPNRGLIYDRNGKLIVYNDAVYDLYVIPRQVEAMDTAKFCELLDIDISFFRSQLQKAAQHSRYQPNLFIKQITTEDFARFSEYLYQFKGFFGELRTIRRYPYSVAAHMVGYTGEVNPSQVAASKYYKSGDYIGINGIEKTYEQYLRGQRGSKYILVDVYNREQGAFRNGEMDTVSVSGLNLITSLDLDLQMYGEELMQNKRGSIVAIEPKTGQILAFVSSPVYDPNLLSGRRRGENFRALTQDTLKPLFNRPIMAQYPPGSIFKPVVALIGLQEKTLKPTDYYTCHPGYRLGSLTIGCRPHPLVRNLSEALQQSCNAYFCNAFKNMFDQKKFESSTESLSKWDEYLYSFGLGNQLGIDIPNELPGLVPTPKTYDKMYANGSWKSSTIISLSIGQGELGITPLQMANMAAVVANKGYHYQPHFAVEIVGDTTNGLANYSRQIPSIVDSAYFKYVIEGMFQTVEKGTARASHIEGIELCGKTGTVQNPHGENHSTFIGFAPKDDPKIAIAVVVENAGGGSRFAAPIGSLIVEKYLNDSVADYRKKIETRILETDLIHPNLPDATQ